MIAKRERKLITWKDADQNLCTLAASMFENAMIILRSPEDSIVPFYPLDDGNQAFPGMAEKEGSKRSIMSEPEQPAPGPDEVIDSFWSGPCPICWWSFQNLIRQRLAMARQELMDNRYLRNKEPGWSKQDSRNPNGRKEGSKFGRKPERE